MVAAAAVPSKLVDTLDVNLHGRNKHYMRLPRLWTRGATWRNQQAHAQVQVCLVQMAYHAVPV
jgi:hypothetical protein